MLALKHRTIYFFLEGKEFANLQIGTEKQKEKERKKEEIE
jgi:hypothetical protein